MKADQAILMLGNIGTDPELGNSSTPFLVLLSWKIDMDVAPSVMCLSITLGTATSHLPTKT